MIDSHRYPLNDLAFGQQCRSQLNNEGCLVLPRFLTSTAVDSLQEEARAREHLAYYCAQKHNVYLTPCDPDYAPDHPRNRLVVSSKGCITDDQISEDSVLRSLYRCTDFRGFLCRVLDQPELFEYADPLSSINVHYAKPTQELGWHFDNSSFAITLMIQPAEQGGVFQFVRGVRDADADEMDFELLREVLRGEYPTQSLQMDAGTLVMFRGRNALHRVTPVEGRRTRMLAVLAYNAEPGVALSESARMTFYGRLS